jgi:hypothetical protein
MVRNLFATSMGYNAEPMKAPAVRNNLRLLLYVFLNTLLAVFGPAALESLVHPSRLFNAYALWWRSPVAFLATEWITEIVGGALFGVVAAKIGWSKAAVWLWLIPTAVFVLAAGGYLSHHQPSFLTRNTGFISHFSGYDCVLGLQGSECNDYLRFTLPLIRVLSYSALALVVGKRSFTRKEVLA